MDDLVKQPLSMQDVSSTASTRSSVGDADEASMVSVWDDSSAKYAAHLSIVSQTSLGARSTQSLLSLDKAAGVLKPPLSMQEVSSTMSIRSSVGDADKVSMVSERADPADEVATMECLIGMS